MKTLVFLFALLVAGCCSTQEVIQQEDHSVPVPTIGDSAVGAWGWGGDWWNAKVDSLVNELANRPEIIRYRDSIVYRDRPQPARPTNLPHRWEGRHITPSFDTTDFAFTLSNKPFFSYESKRGPLRFSELDTVKQYRPTIQEFPFLKKVGLVAISLLIYSILLLAGYLYLRSKGKILP